MRIDILFQGHDLPSLLLLAPVLQAQANDATSTNPGVSKVRIVRLSQVKGSVRDRSQRWARL